MNREVGSFKRILGRELTLNEGIEGKANVFRQNFEQRKQGPDIKV